METTLYLGGSGSLLYNSTNSSKVMAGLNGSSKSITNSILVTGVSVTFSAYLTNPNYILTKLFIRRFRRFDLPV